jgi:hypothetical protein
MAATYENDAPPVPRTIDQLVAHYDNAHPTLKGQLGDKPRTRKQKTKGDPTIRTVPNFNGWLNADKLVEAANDTLERNNVRLKKMEITGTGAAPAATGSRAGPCIQQCSCSLHMTEDDILAAAEEIKKRRLQATRSTTDVELDAKVLTNDRSRSVAAASKYVRLKTSTISSVEELRPVAAAAATVPIYAPGTGTEPAAAAASRFDAIPKSMPSALPKGDGTRAEKIVHMFEEEFCIGSARYPPLLHWTAAKRTAASFADTGTFKKRCIQYLGARYACSMDPEQNQMNFAALEKEGNNFTKEERDMREKGQLTQSYWHDKCVEMYSSK